MRIAKLGVAGMFVLGTLLSTSHLAGAGQPFSCSIRPDLPHRSKGTPTDITAKAQFGCDRAIDHLTITVRLQKRSSTGSWLTVRSHQETFSGAITMANPKKPLVRQVALRCERGAFRTAVQINSAVHGAQTRVGSVGSSPIAIDPCTSPGGGGGGGGW